MVGKYAQTDIEGMAKTVWGGQILISNILFRLAIPSILFAFVNFFPKKILRGEGISVTELLMDTIGGCSLWFTCSLTLVQILVFVMLLSRRKAVWMYVGVAIGIAVLGVVLNKNGAVILGSIDFPWFYKRAMLALLYVVCGGVYYQYEATIMKILKRWYVLLALIAFYIVVEYAFPKNALCLTSMGEMNVLGVLVSIVGSLLLIELCRRINENKVLTYIGKNSIVYYFFSGAIPVTLSALLSCFFPVNSLLVMLLVFLTSLMLASIVSYIVGKWMPALLDFRKIRIK